MKLVIEIQRNFRGRLGFDDPFILGEDLVLSFVRARNPDEDPEGDWEALAELLSLPPTPALFADAP